MLPLEGFGCGVAPTVPKDHVEGVDHLGFVSHWDKLGDLDLGENLRIPLVIGFQSDREWSSPELGYGWVMPIFDSRITQTEENNFELLSVDGYTIHLQRDAKKPTLISGGFWKGEITNGDTIKLWASCGWSLTYVKGKITAIGTPKGKTLTIGREDSGVAKDLTYDSKVLVKVEKRFNGVVTGLQVGEKHLAIEHVERPRIQSIEGKNLVAGKSLSLGKVSSDGIALKSFEYGLTDKLEPKLTATDQGKTPREITWDPATKYIMTDGGWTYEIKPSEKKGLNASIGRKNKSNQEELWFKDSAKGEETVQGADGIKKVRTWFTSGRLAGKTREIKEIELGVTRTVLKNSYDENGRILRSSDGLGVIRVPHYDKVGHVSRDTYELDHSSEYVARRNIKEKQYLEAINSAKNEYKKDLSLRALCGYYLNALHTPEKAEETAKLISCEGERVSVELLSIKANANMGKDEKLKKCQALLAECTSASKIINDTLDKLSKISVNSK